MKTKREDNSSRAVHSPKEHSDSVLGRLGEVHVPQQHLPIQRAAFAPERRAEELAVSSIARSYEALQMMAWDQFVKHGRPREVNVVSAHAHHLCFVAHRIRRIGDLN